MKIEMNRLKTTGGNVIISSSGFTGNLATTDDTVQKVADKVDALSTGGASGGTPSLTLGTANAAGDASTFVRTNDTILAFDATSPSTQAFGDTAVVGVATVAARRDHKHAMPAEPAGGGKGANILDNVGIAATVGSKALTVALKGQDGNDPAAGNIVTIGFRDETLTTGTPNIRTVTGALSVVLSSGSTLGFTAAEAGRLYVWAIDNAGTVELALSRTAIFQETNLVSTTAEGGAGAADSAAAMYSTAARSNVACRCIGYVEITTGATAGEWDNAPTKIQIMGPGVRRTGDVVQIVRASTVTAGSTATTIPADDTIPQITEGAEVLTGTITVTSAINRIHVRGYLPIVSVSGAADMTLALFADSGADALAMGMVSPQGANVPYNISVDYEAVTGTKSVFKLRCGPGANTAYWLSTAGGRRGGGMAAITLMIMEVFA
ncbi:MAG: hypothetical protein HQK65_14725 [Desulfamplus sp.]|nr:hypothetical protein [Desulfamplus sp.]